MHKKGTYKSEDLQKEKPYQNLVKSTYDIFNFAIVDNEVPEEMENALQSDAFLFGSLKANAQLFEASKLLLNEDGRLKPFSELSKQFDGLNVNYNQNYLKAEYEFAVASSQSAAQWANLGGSDRYNLQYRTAKDERVRASHQALADITLPKEDPFWSSFYPPNGWRCRCTAVEVLKSKYDVSNSETAIKAGEKATTEVGKDGKNRLEIFRFNPGQKQVVFPPAHPYRKVKGAKDVEKEFETLEKEDYKILNKAVPFKKNLEYLDDKIKNSYPIDLEKINAVNLYSGHSYFEINKFNRNRPVDFNPEQGITKKYYEALTRTINKALDEIPDKFIGDVWRGARLDKDQLSFYKKAVESGKSITEKGFTSTSYDKSQAFTDTTSFKIKSKTGTKIENLSLMEHEKEVLFKAGQQFKVTKFKEYDGDIFEIEMEEI